MDDNNELGNMGEFLSEMSGPSNDNNVEPERPMTKEERSNKNNTENLRNAADVAIATHEPHAAAVGAAVKLADKVTDGKATELAGKVVTKGLKKVPIVGRKVQKKLNKLNESGAGDMIGKAASLTSLGKGGAPGAAGKAGASAKTVSTPKGSNNITNRSGGKGSQIVSQGGSSTTPPRRGFSGGSGGGKPPFGRGTGGTSSGSNGSGDNGSKGEIAKSGLSQLWKNLPKAIKIKIIITLAGVLLVVALVVLIMSVLIGATSSNQIDYAEAAQPSSDITKQYQEYWDELCSEGDEDCTPEEIEAANELKESQQKFYNKMDSLSRKYNIGKRQKYLVLTTVFYDRDIAEYTEGFGAYEVDSTDEINYEVNTNVYVKERDTLKELIKQFEVYSATCSYTYKNSNGEDVNTSYVLRKNNGDPFTFNWFESATFAIGFGPSDEEFIAAQTECTSSYSGKVSMYKSSTNTASEDNYFKYLRTTDYFDLQPHLSSYYSDYARKNGLDSTNLSSWPEEDLQNVRNEIIENIKDIVDDYMEEKDEFVVVSSGSSYWVPIGSLETTEQNGKLFATDTPQYMHVNSPFGRRIHPITGQPSTHNGVDLQGGMNNSNIIAALGGTVTKTNNSCASSNSNGCGGGYGNFVEIQDVKGNINIYAHMYQNSLLVSVGDTVSQGQVIGKVGSSGNSTGAHLHFTIKINGVAVDPMDYISFDNPRPASSASMPFTGSPLTQEEFIAKMENYYSQPEACKSSSSGCNSFKTQVLNGEAQTIYRIATSHNLNPELVVARSILEGYSPGSSYNYFGYSCYNTGGVAACTKFSSFESAIETFYKNISQYDSVLSMMSRYAYIGDYWYTGVHWGWGGCAYASYIYPDGVPNRVQEACSKPDGTCTIKHEAACVKTTPEDQEAYANWQVEKMASAAAKVFG